MKLAIALVLLLTPGVAAACMVGPNWEEETMQKTDKNGDGKVSFDEYFAGKNGLTEEQKRNNWNALNKLNDKHLTREEFLSAAKPKCMGNQE